MMAEFRCPSKLHGAMDDEGFFEVKCRSRFCGAKPGVVVLHRFKVSGELIETVRFKDPKGAEQQ